MRSLFIKFWDVQSGSLLSSVALLSALFLAGAIVGMAAASYVASEGELRDYITGYVSDYSSVPKTGELVGLAFFNAFKYHLPVVLFGFTALGVFLIPALVLVRGFFLSFAVTSFINVLGSGGLVLALGVLGFQSLITLPCLLLLGAQGFALSTSVLTSGGLRPGIRRKADSIYWGRVGICFAALSFTALFEAFVSPLIVSQILKIFW